MRRYIRHPSDIPIECIEEGETAGVEKAVNVSQGGLSFYRQHALSIHTHIKIRITVVKPVFEAQARVVWCRRQDGGYEIGVAFDRPDEAFKLRMIEQICHIEQYRKKVLEEEGRKLDSESAAAEWIEKFADQFPL